MDHLRVIRDTPYLEVITGPMFSGKSQEISRRISNLDYYNRNRIENFDGDNQVRYIILRPNIDTRSIKIRPLPYKDYTTVNAHDICHDMSGKFIDIFKDYDYIILDEAQFFGREAIEQVKILLEDNKYVIVCGLDKDYKGDPFSEFMSWALAASDETTKLSAVCAVCGAPSTMHKLVCLNKDEYDKLRTNIIIEDENHKYVPMCRKCFYSRYYDYNLKKEK